MLLVFGKMKSVKRFLAQKGDEEEDEEEKREISIFLSKVEPVYEVGLVLVCAVPPNLLSCVIVGFTAAAAVL